MKNETITDFDRQTLTVKNESVTVELFFERNENKDEYRNQNIYDKVIELNEVSDWSSELVIKNYFPYKITKSFNQRNRWRFIFAFCRRK